MTDDTQPEWEGIYSKDTYRHKNEYPEINIIKFMMRHYGDADRSKIRVLELGCGWGNNLKFLKDKGFDYYGIDFSKSAVEHCQKHFKNVVQGDISKLPYEDEFFDCVFDRQAIQCNPKDKIKKIFSEIRRVLKDGGKFFAELIAKGDVDVFSTYLTEDEIRELSKGFKNIELDYYEFSIGNKSEVHRSNLLYCEK